MSGRSLAYLSGVPVERVRGLAGRRGTVLREAGVGSVADLLLHVPRRYIDRSRTVALRDVPVGEEVTVLGEVKKVSTRRPRRNLAIVEAVLFDGTSYLAATWFNQTFRERQLRVGSEVALSGKVERYRGKLQMKSPAVDVLAGASESLVTGRVVPIHPGVGAVSPGYLRRAVHNALQRSRPVGDPLPPAMVERLGLLDRDRALASIHFPESMDEVAPAHRRLVFDELFRLEVALALAKRRKIDEADGFSHRVNPRLLKRFLSVVSLRFKLEQLADFADGVQLPLRLVEDLRSGLSGNVAMLRSVAQEQRELAARLQSVAAEVPGRGSELHTAAAAELEDAHLLEQLAEEVDQTAGDADVDEDVLRSMAARVERLQGMNAGGAHSSAVQEVLSSLPEKLAHLAAGAGAGESDHLARDFGNALPFPPTDAQIEAVHDIFSDMSSPHPMHRLLQGEVGSGKTLVAVFALLAGVGGGFQGAVMAPTEVLAEQHYLGITSLIAASGLAPRMQEAGGVEGTVSLWESLDEEQAGWRRPVAIGLLTSTSAEVNFRPSGASKREEVLEWIRKGEIDVVVGTHALIQEGVHFARLGIAVVDEQHRFGVHQRVRLKEKAVEVDPDLLIMTATPIPRTLSMTLYGDLDVTVLDEMPPGRTPVATVAYGKSPAEMEQVYDRVRAEVERGHQVFVVCPLVEDSPNVEAASATAEAERLQGVFPELRLGLLHGQLAAKDKDAVMSALRRGEIDVLVATTVIEVGIDVPNATLMVIEDADRFGLSQLHQLRGRVGRGSHPATCVLVAEPTTEEGEARLAAMLESTDGFRLAEEDLRIRGQGTVFGARQSGVADLKLADILRDADTLVTARREAFSLVAADPDLSAHGEIRDEVKALLGDAVQWLFIS